MLHILPTHEYAENTHNSVFVTVTAEENIN